MAVIGDVINDDLKIIFTSLAERRKLCPISTKREDYFLSVLLLFLSSKLSEITENEIKVVLYGSRAEDLKCIESYDLGDADIMIFPNSDNMTIREEMFEYSPGNPLHVRIKGNDHPVLTSCLVGDTEYVATSALKNFHPEIFGWASPDFLEIITRSSEAFSREEFLNVSYSRLKNHENSPALTLNYANSLQGSLPVEIMELLAHMLCLTEGINYTKQHAEILDEMMLLLKEIDTTVDPISVCHRFLSCFSRFLGPENFDEAQLHQNIAIFQEIIGLSQNKAMHNESQQSFWPECNDKEETKIGNASNCSRLTSPSNMGAHVTVTSQNSYELESIFKQSTRPNNWTKNSSELTKKLMTSTQTTECDAVESNDAKQNNRHCNDGECVLKTERKPVAQKEELMTLKDLPSNSENKKEDNKREIELKRRVFNCCFKHLLAVENNTKEDQALEKQFKETERFKSGIDFIPAFKSRAWPKVASEWINRDRKWPSPDVVHQITQEGVHLVVKAPKNNGNSECDFRISFSHAEYLLSQEMNDIQRKCYRFLKRYHRAYLSTQPKSLLSFHLKNVFLQTIEETGTEVWTESNRVEYMTKLLGNLLKAITTKDLRHFFVRSYNLFGVDYIENPDILQSLAGKVKQFMENPMRFLKELSQNELDAVQLMWKEYPSNINAPSNEPTVPADLATRQLHEKIEEMLNKGNYDTNSEIGMATVSLLPSKGTQNRGPAASYRYHDLKDIYQEVTKELVNVAFNGSSSKLETVDPLKRSLVEDLRELQRKHDLTDPVGKFLEIFDYFWDNVTFLRVMFSTEQDLTLRMLDAVQGLVEIMKHTWKEGKFPDIESILHTIGQDSSIESSFDLNHIFPSGLFTQLTHRFLDSSTRQTHLQRVVYDIPLD